MSKRLILVLAFAFVLGVSFAAYAEVQNVKVSGDLTIGGVYRQDFDLAKPRNIGSGVATFEDKEQDVFTITRIRVDTDLTDNVSAVVRLINERNWNGDTITGLSENNRNIGFAAANGANKESQIDLDLAYVTLKEFLYSPLTLKVGRQEMRFGNGWIVGDPDTNGLALKSALAEGDLSLRKSFDAVRATLDYNPLMVDVIYSKIAENNTILNDDTTLYGLNAAYELDKNTTLEGFFFTKIRGSDTPAATFVDATTDADIALMNATLKDKGDVVNTVGGRIVNRTIKNLTIDAQGAYQFGIYNPKFDPNARFDGGFAAGGTASEHIAGVGDRKAWGTEIIAMYDLKDCKHIGKYNPMIGAAYVYLSGEDRDRVGNSTYHGWDAMFEDQTFGHVINAIMGFTNVTLGGVTMQAKPWEDVSVRADYVRAYLNKRLPTGRAVVLSGISSARQFIGGNSDDRYLGQEIDLSVTYDYTEDVQFSLLGGYFLPGKTINTQGTQGQNVADVNQHRASATEVIGSMKVVF